MAHGPRYAVKFRRRREGKTDYRRRLALLKGGKTRLVVRRTNTRTIVQFVDYHTGGDVVRAQAVSSELKKYGWTSAHPNTPSSYLVGLLAGKRAAQAGVEEAVLDLGLAQAVTGGGLFAALKGAIDGGVEVPHGDDVMPDEDRLKGAHLKSGTPDEFEKARQQIMGLDG